MQSEIVFWQIVALSKRFGAKFSPSSHCLSCPRQKYWTTLCNTYLVSFTLSSSCCKRKLCTKIKNLTGKLFFAEKRTSAVKIQFWAACFRVIIVVTFMKRSSFSLIWCELFATYLPFEFQKNKSCFSMLQESEDLST